MEGGLTKSGRAYLAEANGPNPGIPRQTNVSVTQQFIDDVIAAGGTMGVPEERWNDPIAIAEPVWTLT